MVHAAPADRTERDACATAAAVLTPPAPPVNDHKSAGAAGGEPQDGPWSPSLFDTGGDTDSITKELSPPRAMKHQLKLCHGEWLEPGEPILIACSLSVCLQ